MNTVSARRVRQVVQRQGAALESLAPVLREMNAFAQQTRTEAHQEYEALWNMAKTHDREIAAVGQWRALGFWGRLRWLLTGEVRL